MQVIAAIGAGLEVRGILRIARGGIEIDYGVKRAAGADPFIHGLSIDFAFRRVVVRAFKGEDGAAVDANVVGVGAR